MHYSQLVKDHNQWHIYKMKYYSMLKKYTIYGHQKAEEMKFSALAKDPVLIPAQRRSQAM